MTEPEKKVFIQELMDSVRQEIYSKLYRTPEEWNGHELRQLVADKFNDATTLDKDERDKRYKDYLNTVITQNL